MDLRRPPRPGQHRLTLALALWTGAALLGIAALALD